LPAGNTTACAKPMAGIDVPSKPTGTAPAERPGVSSPPEASAESPVRVNSAGRSTALHARGGWARAPCPPKSCGAGSSFLPFYLFTSRPILSCPRRLSTGKSGKSAESHLLQQRIASPRSERPCGPLEAPCIRHAFPWAYALGPSLPAPSRQRGKSSPRQHRPEPCIRTSPRAAAGAECAFHLAYDQVRNCRFASCVAAAQKDGLLYPVSTRRVGPCRAGQEGDHPWCHNGG